MKSILEFLSALEKNNNREWFNANKQLYEENRRLFLLTIGKIIKGISAFDRSISQVDPKNCVFRIYRDTRFSADKTPYKNNFGAFISKDGFKSHHCGYYFHIQPGEYFVSAGIYMPMPETLARIRSEIYHHYAEFKSIVEHPDYQKYNIKFWEDKLKRPPKNFDPDFEGIEWLKYKSIAPFHELSERDLLSENLIEKIVEVYRILFPLNQFLDKALS